MGELVGRNRWEHGVIFEDIEEGPEGNDVEELSGFYEEEGMGVSYGFESSEVKFVNRETRENAVDLAF